MYLRDLITKFKVINVIWFKLSQTLFVDLPELHPLPKQSRKISVIDAPNLCYVAPFTAFWVFELADCFYLDYVRGIRRGAFYRGINAFLAQANKPVVTAILPTNKRALAAAMRLNPIRIN